MSVSVNVYWLAVYEHDGGFPVSLLFCIFLYYVKLLSVVDISVK